MGCDIHVRLEQRVDGRWYPRGADLAQGRDYESFGILAGVRGIEYEPIVEPRGLPNDSPWVKSMKAGVEYLGDHNFSWLTAGEILSYPMAEKILNADISVDLDINPGLPLFLSIVADMEWLTTFDGIAWEDLRIVFGFDS